MKTDSTFYGGLQKQNLLLWNATNICNRKNMFTRVILMATRDLNVEVEFN